MARIRVLDGTREQKWGVEVLRVLQELSHLQRVSATPRPGSIDVPSYELVKHYVELAFNESRPGYREGRRVRGQVNLDTLRSLLSREPLLTEDRGRQTVVMVEEDLYAHQPDGRPLNWCFGSYRRLSGLDIAVFSTARMQSTRQWFDLVGHELGHMYGAAPRGRSNTVENLGSHCITDLCVMQQKTSIEDSIRYVERRHRAGAELYCGQCKDDMRKSGF